MKNKKCREVRYSYFQNCSFAIAVCSMIEQKIHLYATEKESVKIRYSNRILEPFGVRVFELPVDHYVTSDNELRNAQGDLLKLFDENEYFSMLAKELYLDSGIDDITSVDVMFATTDCGPISKRPSLLFYWEAKK